MKMVVGEEESKPEASGRLRCDSVLCNASGFVTEINLNYACVTQRVK